MRDRQKRISRIEAKAGIQQERPAPDPENIEWITLDDLEKLDAHQLVKEIFRERANVQHSRILEFEDPVFVRNHFDNIGRCIAIDLLLEDEQPEHPDSRFVQIQHPVNKRWKLIDREQARIVKSNEQSFKNIPVISIK
jgi:hypothetical protein